MKKIPPEAFDVYFSLGPGRSYQAVAERYGVTKRAVTNLAKREDWQRRLVEIEAKAREEADRKSAQTLKAVQERQLQSLRLVQRRAIERLRETPIETAAEAARALAQAIRQENVILGEPGDRTAVSVEETIRREYERWMVVEKGGADPARDPDADDVEADDVGRPRVPRYNLGNSKPTPSAT